VPASKEIIVDCEGGSAVLRGADVFVPGILGMVDGIVVGEKVSVWADLEGKCIKGWKRAFTGGSKRFLGNGISRASRSDVFEQQVSSGVGIVMVELEHKMPGLNGVLEDLVFLQNLPSIMAGLALAPTPGSRVLDMCASPGGKTCHLAALMENTGLLVAVDKNGRKVAKIEENFERLGVRNGKCIVADSTRLSQLGDIFLDGSFDFILLDPPCSGLGQRPKLNLSLDDFSAATLSGYAPYQGRLFDQAWRLLKPGGCLVYSTCTINPDENEVSICRALERHSDARLVPLRRDDERFLKYAGPGLPVPGMSAEQSADCLCRFWPRRDGGFRDTVGFFLAKLQKSR
jgi:16S rRNA C967 or C1407 C5-methylase (RsmB/RsmF family)